MPLSCASFRNRRASRGRMESNLLFFLVREVRKRDALRPAYELHDPGAQHATLGD
jgi:hypothetical protein